MGKYDYPALAKKRKWTEKEMNAFKNHLNRVDDEERRALLDVMWENTDENGTIDIDSAWQAKGEKWLYSQGFTPKGKERMWSPYGYREEEVVKNIKSISLSGFHNTSFFSQFYVPVYYVEGKDGGAFEYYVSGGEIHITG